MEVAHGAHPCADRPERRRQDHVLQSGHRRARGRRRHASCSRAQLVDDARPSRRTLRGIARTFQNIRLFPHLTVLETVMIGEHCRSYPSMWKALAPAPCCSARSARRAAERRMRENALELLAFLGLADQRDAKASDLPYGDQRRLEMARALATQPRLLLLDEPAAGMNPHETARARRSDHAHPRPRRHHHPGRARHAPGDGHFRPRHGAQLRHQDRRRRAATRSRTIPR